MAFFKFPFPGRDRAPKAPAAAQGPAESVETLRRRARHRLIGAAVLVLIGVVGFPLLFDTQPRPVAVDIPIEIPDRSQARPLAQPQAAPAPVASAPVAPAREPAAVAEAPAPASTSTPVPAPAAPSVETRAAAEPAARPQPTPAPVPAAPAPAVRAPDGARAQALLEGRAAAPAAATEPKAADSGRFVVQVGAFSDDAKAREARQKVERAGLKTYTQVVDTKDGKRTRVRVGPFASRADADKAASRIKGLDLPAAVLTL